jgi:hypothetical protein
MARIRSPSGYSQAIVGAEFTRVFEYSRGMADQMREPEEDLSKAMELTVWRR